MSGINAFTAFAVTLISTLGGVVPIFLGLIVAELVSSRKRAFSAYGPAISLGILLSTFYDVIQETAGLQLGILNPIPQTITVVLFVIGLLVMQLFSNQSRSKLYVTTLFAYGWAVGIGLHGFGEGTIIGYGFISGQAEYANIIQVVSFGLHKVGEGFTVGALVAISSGKLNRWTASGLIAGLPVGIGGVLGYLMSTAWLSTYAFAVGAGFAAYFIIHFSRLLPKQNGWAYVAVAAGFLFMYFAGLLHQF